MTLDQILTAPVTAITSPSTPVDGQFLVVILRQDAAGGRRISWDAAFSGAATEITTDPSTISTFLFCGSGGKWFMVGTPSTGMNP